jgi:peroxiredoxin
MQNVTETLGIGSRAPDFKLKDANGSRTFSLAGLLAKGPVVLEFMRGTWCASCQKRLIEIEKAKTELWQAGAQLVYIAAEKSGGLWQPESFLKSHSVSFPFLLDEDCSVIKAYGLFHRVGIDAWNIAHPATLIVPSEGRIRYIFKGLSQSDRSPFDSVLKRLHRLNLPATSQAVGTGR